MFQENVGEKTIVSSDWEISNITQLIDFCASTLYFSGDREWVKVSLIYK